MRPDLRPRDPAPGPATDAVIELTALRFGWPGAAAPCLEIDALHLAAGERLLVLGPSGSGKSTLLALVGGVLAAAPGQVRLLGHDLGGLPARSRDRLRVDHVGFLFQQFNLLPWLPSIDNVLLPCRFSRRRAQRVATGGEHMGEATGAARAGEADATKRPGEAVLRTEAVRLLDRLGIGPGLRARPVTTLSVGQQQRVAAARALIGRPELMLADEPTSALDPSARDALMELLAAESAATGMSWIFVSHDPALAPRCDRTLQLGGGR